MDDVIQAWCPNYPRRASSRTENHWAQITVNNERELKYSIKNVEGEYPCYVSTYSFPDGHPSDGEENIPRIDTLMIDFDFEFDKQEFKYSEWKSQLRSLLIRTRMLSKELLDQEFAKYWRASLSGYKGVHLYLDFSPIRQEVGTAAQFYNGMEQFADEVIETLEDESNITLSKFIDVTSGWDLSRLTRLPNTIHEKATEQFREKRYCVPVSIEELRHVDVNQYVALTKNPRPLPESCKRIPNPKSTERAEHLIKTSENEWRRKTYSASMRDEKRYKNYVEDDINEKVTLDDVKFLLKRKPCIWEYAKNREKFNHGAASHTMEIQCILAMASIGTPVEVMHEFFAYHPEKEVHPKYDSDETDKRIKEVLSRQYGEFNCSKILTQAPQFCLHDGCKIYQGDESLRQID